MARANLRGGTTRVYRWHGSSESGCTCGDNALTNFYRSPVTAFITAFVVMGAVLLGYFLVHQFRTPPAKPWASAIYMAKDATFQVQTKDYLLEKFFSDDQIRSLMERLAAKTKVYSADAIRHRRAVLGAAAQLVHLAQSNENLGLTLDPAMVDGANDADLAAANIDQIGDWFEQQSARERAISRDRIPEYRAIVAHLRAMAAAEQAARLSLQDEIATLEPPLSFYWMYHETAGWLFEVSIWSLLGVLAHAIINLIMRCRDNRYDPAAFVLMFPKFFLAPLVSVIVVSLWAAGFTKSGITFLNLPYFLAFSFFLGFCTENLYTKLHQTADVILGEIDMSEEKFRRAGEKLTYAAKYPLLDPAMLAKPKTVADLSDNLRKILPGVAEHSILTHLGARPVPAGKGESR